MTKKTIRQWADELKIPVHNYQETYFAIPNGELDYRELKKVVEKIKEDYNLVDAEIKMEINSDGKSCTITYPVGARHLADIKADIDERELELALSFIL